MLFFLPVLFFPSWLVPQNEFDEQQVKENPFFFFLIWEEGGLVSKKSKWNFKKFSLKLLKLIILEQAILERHKNSNMQPP